MSLSLLNISNNCWFLLCEVFLTVLAVAMQLSFSLEKFANVPSNSLISLNVLNSLEMKLLNRFNILISFFVIAFWYSTSGTNFDLLSKYFSINELKKTLGDIFSSLNSRRKNWDKTCGVDTKAHRSIIYVKVQKTGSTTLRSTLLVYGRHYDLNICFDSTNLWGLNWPYPVDELKLTKLYEEKCELIAEEFVFDPRLGCFDFFKL